MARSRRKDVRILLVGESGVGKTSLILSLVSEEFPEVVPVRAEEITIPPDVTPENVNTQIVDYSNREQSEEELFEELKKANVICIVYSVDDDETIERITRYWLPTIRDQLGEEHTVPVVLVGNKVDLHEYSTLDSIVPIMNQYSEIETCVECSAKSLKNISELFYYAQKAVLHPTSPLYSSESKYLTDKCQKALARIFKLCDEDNDGILNDQELNRFQLRCFNSPLQDAALEDVKNIVKRSLPDGVFDDGLTLSGFQFLHTLFIQRGRDETTWTVLRKFGYNDCVELDDDYLHPGFEIPEGCTVELSTLGIQFLTQLFHKYDLDKDSALSPNELQNLFSLCPYIPELFSNDSIQNYIGPEDNNYVKLNAFISLWTLSTLVNPKLTLEFLAYLGYIKPPEEHQLTAIHVTRDKRVDLQKKQTSRNVFTCHLIGPQGAGKSSFMKGFLGKNLQDQVQFNFALKVGCPNYVINTLPIYGQEKYLIMREVDIFHLSDKLSEPELFCDVICLMFDSSNPKSFEYVARIFLKHFVNCKLPILIVAAKSDEQQVIQQYSLQPEEFCSKYNLPKVHPFTATEIKQDVYIKLCTMAAYPNLGRLVHVLLMRPSSSWVSNHFNAINTVLNTENSTVIKTGIGIATLAMVGFLVVRFIKNSHNSFSTK